MARERIYHRRTRDGVPVVWTVFRGKIRLLSPPDRPVTPEQIAGAVLADALGWEYSRPRAAAFARFLGRYGSKWDFPIAVIRAWAARENRP